MPKTALVVRNAIWGVTLIASAVLFTRFRTIPDVFLVVALVAWWRRPTLRRWPLALVALVGFLALEFALPFDVSMVSRPGGPRVVRLLMGKPSAEAIARAEAGEFVLGGCALLGNEPGWMLVW